MNKHHIISFTGKMIDPCDPQPEDFTLEDIAFGLSREERFNGATRRPYYVAQHSVHVANVAAQRKLGECPCDSLMMIKACLLHDATEAYLKDMVNPLKALLPDYRQLEACFELMIAARFNIPAWAFHSALKERADRDVFRVEVACIAKHPAEVYLLNSEENREFAAGILRDVPSLEAIQNPWSRKGCAHEFLELCNLLEIK